MSESEFRQHIHRTLLYYEIFDHPLSLTELFHLFPKNSLSRLSFTEKMNQLVDERFLSVSNGLYYLAENSNPLTEIRYHREQLAKKRLRIAKLISHIMRRMPFVQGVFLSGDLSKGVATPPSDIDYVIVTEPQRLWICRTFLIMFKKIFLLNSKKYFCVNYFVSSDNLELDYKNYYTATEVAHLKPLYNFQMFLKYMNSNRWIISFFPNYSLYKFVNVIEPESKSVIQRLLEIPFRFNWGTTLDEWLQQIISDHWKKRYNEYDASTRELIFRSTRSESRAFAGNFSFKIGALYHRKLSAHNLE